MTFSVQYLALWMAATACLAGCEGNVNPEPDGNAGSGNAGASGSNSATSASGGKSSTSLPNASGGAATGGQAGTMCCLAMAVCDANSKMIAG
ncbi:MAG TPA: hypothetical protein VIV60_04835, partial [Polyangiaceae bacterium]